MLDLFSLARRTEAVPWVEWSICLGLDIGLHDLIVEISSLTKMDFSHLRQQMCKGWIVSLCIGHNDLI